MFFFTLVGFNFVCMSSFTKGGKGAWQMTITRMVIVLKNNNNKKKKIKCNILSYLTKTSKWKHPLQRTNHNSVYDIN